MGAPGESVRGRVFDRAEALAAGLTPGMLRGPGFERVSSGLYCHAGTPLTLDRVAGPLLGRLPPDAALSHTSALAWRGLTLAPTFPLHAATRHDKRSRRPELVSHRYQQAIEVEMVRGLPVLAPARTFVDCGTLLSLSRMVQVGDWLVAQRLVDLVDLRTYVVESHLDGVQRARKAAELVRKGAESVRESWLRFELVAGGLPEPELNVDIRSDTGRFLARGDLVYRRQKVVVEYDGWYHERDAFQRRKDVLRREALEAAGWRVIVVTSLDMADPKAVVRRVAAALTA